MTKKKTAFAIISVIVALVCLIPIVSWIYIYFWGKTKNPSYVYNASEIVLADGSKEDIVKLRYYANTDKSGLEMLDIDSSSFFDETRQDVKSQGLQFVAENAETPIKWTIGWDDGYLNRKKIGRSNWYWETNHIGFRKRFYASFGTWGLKSGLAYNYATSNGYETTYSDNNPLSANTGFKISLQDNTGNPEVFLMQFKGRYFEVEGQKIKPNADGKYKAINGKNNWYPAVNDFDKNSNFVQRHKDGLHGDYTYYIDTFYTYDPYWFAYELYQSVAKAVKPGTSEYVTFSWGNLFNFKKYDEESKTYKTVEGNEWTKVANYVSTNITVKVEVIERGAQKASDSLFNVIKEDPTFNLTGDKTYDDYFYGQNIVNLDVTDFDLVQVVDTQYCLKLSNNAYNHYSKFKDIVLLSININLDILNERNYNFVGFTKDSRLDEFNIYEIYTTETVDGQILRTEVDYGTIT